MGKIGDTISTVVPEIDDQQPDGMQRILDLLNEYKTRLTSKVKLSSLDAADQALDLNGQELTNAEYLGLAAMTSAPVATPNGRIARYGGNMYWCDVYGAVQVTSGAGLNAAAIGGIVGDYGGVNPAKVAFVDADETYIFWDNQSASQYAKTRSRGLDLVDEATGRMARLAAPATIAATYDLTVPATLPAATKISLLSINDVGQMKRAEEAAITEAFTADVKHGDITEWELVPATHTGFGAGAWSRVNGAAAPVGHVGELTYSAPTGELRVFLKSPPVGRRVKGFKARVSNPSGGTVTVRLYKNDVSGGAPTQIGSGSITLAGINDVITTPTETVVDRQTFFADVEFTGAASGTPVVYAIALVHDYV